MAAPATPSNPAEAGSAGPTYLQGCPEGFRRLADVRLVVQGQELPCHSQFLARYCRVFGDMLPALAEAPPAASATAAAPAFSAAAPLRLEGPFKGVLLEHAELFLRSLYCPGEVNLFAYSPVLQSLEAFEGVYDVANQLDCGLLLGALSSRLASSNTEPLLKQDLLGWIAFADRWARVRVSA